jgi:hypothetical protein
MAASFDTHLLFAGKTGASTIAVACTALLSAFNAGTPFALAGASTA